MMISKKKLLEKGLAIATGVILTFSFSMNAMASTPILAGSGSGITANGEIGNVTYGDPVNFDGSGGSVGDVSKSGNVITITDLNLDGTLSVWASGYTLKFSGNNSVNTFAPDQDVTIDIDGSGCLNVTTAILDSVRSMITTATGVSMVDANGGTIFSRSSASSGSESGSSQSGSSESSSSESGAAESVSEESASTADSDLVDDVQARIEEQKKSSHFEVTLSNGGSCESEVKGSFYYEQGAAVVKGNDEICKDKDDYAVNTYVANENCQKSAYASLAGYAAEGGYGLISATSFNIIDLVNNPYCVSRSWFEANENNTITGDTKTFAFSNGSSITTDKYTTAIAGLPEATEGKVIIVGVTNGGVVFTQEDQDDDPSTVTFYALLGSGVYGFLVK